MKKQYFVDLFAGCGGLSLGLERAGFHPAYVNELDKNAMETYLTNRDDEYPLLRKKYHSSNVLEITSRKNSLDNLLSSFEEDYGMKSGDLGMIVGGPPCQGYSHIGHRRSYTVQKKDIPSNHLYLEMTKAIKKLKPKAFLFENVSGLLWSRWTKRGEKGEIWRDVERSFNSIKEYEIRWELVKAKSYGVPQNRPRVFLVGIRNDIKFEYDIDLPAGGMLPKPTNDFPDPADLLGDLVDPDYQEKKHTGRYPKSAKTPVQRKMRAKKKGRGIYAKGDYLTEQEYSNHSKKIMMKFSYMLRHDGKIPTHLTTKKFGQRVIPPYWNGVGPNITVASLPDDYVHFSQPRILTVREWARLQTFPDWYQFTGKRTTGGVRRAGNPKIGLWDREVPKYTQIGNAVPVKLAEEIGKHIMKIIS